MKGLEQVKKREDEAEKAVSIKRRGTDVFPPLSSPPSVQPVNKASRVEKRVDIAWFGGFVSVMRLWPCGLPVDILI